MNDAMTQDSPVRILFVDDEEYILNSLKRSFSQADYDILTADSGKTGLEILEQQPVDVVISDFKMPEMNGLQFLGQVREKHPQALRAFLSGYIDQLAVIKALTNGIATAYFPKPWNDEELKASIDHILGIQKALREKRLTELMDSASNLPTMPAMYQKFSQAINSGASLGQIANLISEDAVITTRILQISNSAFFGRGQTASIEQAIMILGLDTVKNIILTIALATDLQIAPEKMQNFEKIIKHSSLVNKYFLLIYKMAFGRPVRPENTSLCITHDIGKIVQLQYFPERFQSILDFQAKNPHLGFYQCELELGYGETAHTLIGGYLLDLWNLPKLAVEVAMLHHTDEHQNHINSDTLKVAYLTNELVNVLTMNPEIKQIDDSNLDTQLLQQLNLRADRMDFLLPNIKKDMK
jgi:HD-like signal output (HDOD) protein/CheY-like chemotaxis protein